MKTQEVELRATIPSSHKPTLMKQLKSMMPTVKKVVRLVDVYYAPLTAETMADIPMNEVGSFSLRIRMTVLNDQSVKLTFNMKVVTNFGDHNAWDESEVVVDDPRALSKMLRALGYFPFCVLSKTRTSYGISEVCTIGLDDIDRYGLVVEIEHIVPAEEAEAAKQKNQETFKTLGVTDEHMVPRTATEEYMKMHAFKDVLDDDEIFALLDRAIV